MSLTLLLLISSGCRNSITDQEGFDVREAFLRAFHDPECSNPCWLGIEVGVTNQATVIAILEEQGIEYGVPGVIHLHSIPQNTVPGINPIGVPPVGRSVNVFGDINVGQQSSDIVQSIDFFLDLCVSTVIEAYGVPNVRFVQDSIPTTLVYVDYQLLFFVDKPTKRIDGVILHIQDAMPLPDELEDWSVYADVFSEECRDVFTESQG